MDLDTSRPFRGSSSVRRGDLTWGALAGPRFRRLEHDTYVAADVVDTPELALRALLVSAGPAAVATGWSACTALGLDVAPRPMPTEISAPGRRLAPRPPAVIRQRVLPPDEVIVEAGMATTTPLRTAFDLACRAGPERGAVDRLVGPLIDAVVACDALARLGAFTADDLTAAAVRHPGARGVRRVDRVAALLDPLSESPPETRARVRIVLAGLPRPVLQFPVNRGTGSRPWRLDLAWPRYRVALEYDGRDHSLADRRGNDIDRLDALRRDGWLVIVVTAHQMRRPLWAVDRVREALTSRGWVASTSANDDQRRIMVESARRS